MLTQTIADDSTSSNSKYSDKISANIPKIRNLINTALKQMKEDGDYILKDVSNQIQTEEIRQRASLNLYLSKSEEAVVSLQKGYVMTKHSPKTSPHGKFVYLSADQRELCWKSLDKNDEKKIQLRKIETVLRGQEETIGCVKSGTISSLEKLVLIKSSVRNLELQAINIQESLKFQLELQEVTKRAKSMYMSYNL